MLKHILLGLAIIGSTSCGSDSIFGSTPVSLTATTESRFAAKLSWFIPGDLIDLDYWEYGIFRRYEYWVYQDGVLETKVKSYGTFASARVENLEHSTRYCFDVRMKNSQGNIEVASDRVCTTTTIDKPPTIPQNLSVNAVSPAQIDLSWDASSDDFGLRAYKIYRDGSHLTTIFGSRSASDTLADPQTTHCYTVTATDELFNESRRSIELCATTPADLVVPTAPTGLQARYESDYSGKHIQLTWAASSDDGLVRYYKVYRDGIHIADAPDNLYADDTFEIETEYCYFVIAVDAAGKQSAPSNQSCDTSSWLSSTVDYGGFPMVATMGIDSSDLVHIAYKSTINSPPIPSRPVLLKHATSDTGTWGGSHLVEDGTDSYNLSIAIDPNGDAHVAYQNFLRLRYADNTSGIWQIEDIESGSIDVDSLDLVIDSTGVAHICYSDFYQLKYATNKNGSWVVTDVGVALSTWGNFSCALTLDSADNAHISYIDSDHDQLFYATNKTGSWTTQIVTQVFEQDAAAGVGTSIVIDATNSVHISYHDYNGNKDLKYASNQSGVWVVKTLDSAGDVGRNSAIAIDSAGNLHISYGDATNSNLKYANNTSGEWKLYTIDNASPWPKTSIAVDSTNRIHISYSGITSSIKHSTNRNYD